MLLLIEIPYADKIYPVSVREVVNVNRLCLEKLVYGISSQKFALAV